jgi:hypothetical protein
MTQTKVQSAIPVDIHGTVQHIDYYAGPTAYLKITDDDGKRYSVSQNRVSNAPGSHKCLIRVNDEILFRVNPEGSVVDVKFKVPPEATLSEEEESIIDVVTPTGLIFGKRLGCHCPILIGTAFNFPELEPGMKVRHGLGILNSKYYARDVRVDWNAMCESYGEKT